jgi:hypothetical protein
VSPRPATTTRPILTIYPPINAVSRKEVPFGGLNASKNFQGVHFPQTPKIGPGIGTFSLNKTINNFSTVHAIFAQIHSVGAAWRQYFKNFNEISNIPSQESLLGKRPQ